MKIIGLYKRLESRKPNVNIIVLIRNFVMESFCAKVICNGPDFKDKKGELFRIINWSMAKRNIRTEKYIHKVWTR